VEFELTITAVKKVDQYLEITEDGKVRRISVDWADCIVSAIMTGKLKVLNIYRNTADDLFYADYLDANEVQQTVQLGGGGSVSELSDVDLTGLSDGDILYYDLASLSWMVKAESPGVTHHGDLAGLTDDDHTQYQKQPDNVITVAPAGADYTTIAAALAAASSGDVILIYPSTYAESNLTLVNGVNLVGTDPDQCIISVADAANPIINSAVNCAISNLTIWNTNAGAPAIKVTANTLTIRNCNIKGTGAGDAIQMIAGTLNVYDSTKGAGDIDLSTAICTLNMYRCRITTDPIDTSGAFAHVLTLEHCNLGYQNINSSASGATTLVIRGCTNVGTVTNAGTGVFTIEQSQLITIAVTNAAGSAYLTGGSLVRCTKSTGIVVWYLDYTRYVVIYGMKIGHAIADAAASNTIYIAEGRYGESNLTMKSNLRLVGLNPEPNGIVIGVTDAANPIIRSSETCFISNITIENTSSAQPAILSTLNPMTLVNCLIEGAGTGDSLQIQGGIVKMYDCKVREDIDLSVDDSELYMYRCQLDGHPIDTSGNFAHTIVLEHCDLDGQAINSQATGATTLDLRCVSNVGTITNSGTGAFTNWIDDVPVDGETTAPISSNWAADHITPAVVADPHTQYQKESEKSAASGYASLDAGTKVPTAELGGAGADNTKYLRGDQSWQEPAGGGDVATDVIWDAAGDIAVGTGSNAAAVVNLAVQRILGRLTGEAVKGLTAAEVRTLINVEDGANAYVHPNHSGEVTSVADGAQTIAANAVTLAKLATQATDTFLANVTAGSAVPTAEAVAEQRVVGRITGGHIAALTVAQLQALLFSLALVEDALILLDAALSADTHYSGIAEAATAGTTNLVYGYVYYLDTATLEWELTNAIAAATSKGKIGICVVAANHGSAGVVLLWGKIRADDEFPAMTVGSPVFLSAATAGLVTSTAPTGTTNFVVRIVGYANTADELFFCPDNTYLELA
jgi:hypothetical protein